MSKVIIHAYASLTESDVALLKSSSNPSLLALLEVGLSVTTEVATIRANDATEAVLEEGYFDEDDVASARETLKSGDFSSDEVEDVLAVFDKMESLGFDLMYEVSYDF